MPQTAFFLKKRPVFKWNKTFHECDSHCLKTITWKTLDWRQLVEPLPIQLHPVWRAPTVFTLVRLILLINQLVYYRLGSKPDERACWPRWEQRDEVRRKLESWHWLRKWVSTNSIKSCDERDNAMKKGIGVNMGSLLAAGGGGERETAALRHTRRQLAAWHLQEDFISS